VNPEELLQDGVAILDDTLRPHGFAFIPGESGKAAAAALPLGRS
jgi:hypothetical protein